MKHSLKYYLAIPVFIWALAITTPLLALDDEGAYQVGPGDVIQVTVTGEPDFTGTFTVRSDNQIFYTYLKEIPVGGKTVQEITDDLSKRLREGYIKEPNVNVTVKEFASQVVQVVGAVAKQGSYTLKGPTHLLDILTQAGGPINQTSTQVVVLRQKSSQSDPPIVISYSDLLSKGLQESNILLKAGDVVNVQKSNEVYVMGEVSKPGPVTFANNLTLLQAVSIAGGPTQTASTRSTYIIRTKPDGKSERLSVRLDKVMDQKAENPEVKPGDVIVVPESLF